MRLLIYFTKKVLRYANATRTQKLPDDIKSKMLSTVMKKLTLEQFSEV